MLSSRFFFSFWPIPPADFNIIFFHCVLSPAVKYLNKKIIHLPKIFIYVNRTINKFLNNFCVYSHGKTFRGYYFLKRDILIKRRNDSGPRSMHFHWPYAQLRFNWIMYGDGDGIVRFFLRSRQKKNFFFLIF